MTTDRSSDKSFTTSFTVDQTPEEVFEAINNVRGWWTGDFEGNTDALGEEFIYRYKENHYSKQKITELVPGKKVVWHVLESQINFVADKNEWTGTDIIFDISKEGDKTVVHFTHKGLIPAYECFGKCSDAWTFLINGNLKNLIMDGKGQATF